MAMQSCVEVYGRTPDGQDVHRIVLEDGLRVSVLTVGGVIETLEAPGPSGQRKSVVLGLDSLEGYLDRSPHFGEVAGRFANRIAGGRFVLDGVGYQLACNNGPNALHGGVRGFGKVIWTVEAASPREVTLGYVSRDGEEGYPGTLRTRVTYTVENETLRLQYAAETDRATVLNLTNHSYFNLGGEGSGDVMDHVLQVEADGFLPTDATGIPTGEIRPVAGTPFDFTAPHAVGERIRVGDEQILFGRGYDHCFVLRGGGMRRAATVLHPASRRTMEVWTDQPGVQVYSGNMLTGVLAGPSGRAYRPGDGLCLETQHFPDSPNRPDFPSTVLRPGEVFRSVTEYRFLPT